MRVFFLFYILVAQLIAYSSYDLKIRTYDATPQIGLPATMVEFGGDEAPLCRFAISNDKKYFYLTKVGSTCYKAYDSSGRKLICTADRAVCYTRGTLRRAISKSFPKYGEVYNLGDRRYGDDGFLSLRSGPSSRYYELDRLYNGDRVKILGQKGYWYRIKALKNGKYGWVYFKYIRRVNNPSYAQSSRLADNAPNWCRSAHLNETERAICTNAELSGLDRELAELYRRYRESHDDGFGQGAWLKYTRNACGNDIQCLKKAYISRKREFEDNTNNKITPEKEIRVY